MRVRYFAYVREFSRCGSSEEEYRPTVRELLIYIGEKYGADMKKTLWAEEGKLVAEEILVVVNGKKLFRNTVLDYPLQPDDVISLFRVVTGG